MISIVSGLPGSGKTLSAIKRFLIPAIKDGRRVYSNIEGLDVLNLSLYTHVYFENLEKNLIVHEPLRLPAPSKVLSKSTELEVYEQKPEPFKFSTDRMINGIELNSLVIIDEAQTIWNNSDYASEENKRFLPFLQKHRHYGIDIVFLTQNIDQLDIGIRRLCQVHYRLCRLTNLGLDKSIKVKVFPDAMGSEQFKPLAILIWKIDKGIFGFYNSYQGIETKEAQKKNYNVFLRSPILIFCAVVFILCLSLTIWNFKGKGFGFVTGKSETALSEAKAKDFSNFNLGEYDEYYCGDKFYVLRPGGIVDTLQPKDIPPTYCPTINYNFKRASK